MMLILLDLMLAVNGSIVALVLIKVTVVFALALFGTRLARRSPAAVRHVVLAAAFAVLLGLPIASFVVPTIRIAVPLVTQKTVASPPVGKIPSKALPASPVSAGVGAGTGITPSPTQPFSLSAALSVAWMIISILFLLPIGAGLWQMHSLRKSGEHWRQGQSILDALAIEAGFHRRIEVLLHEGVSGPMTCGIVRPIVLLPVDARAWAEEDLRRAAIHELEHVRRGDWASQCFARAMCACYWFHPLVWIARRRLGLEAERACDDAVLRRAEATGYAKQLVALAERLSTTSKHRLLAMANPGDLTMRVRAVLDQRQRRGRAGKLFLTFASTAAVLVVVVASILQIDMVAQAAAQPRSQPVQQSVSGQTRQPPVLPQPSGPRLKFEAASVRVLEAQQTGSLPLGLRCRAVDGEFPAPAPGTDPAPLGRCVGTFPMVALIHAALLPSLSVPQLYNQYAIFGLSSEFDITGPTSPAYQLQAVAANPSRATKADLQEMLQALLRDRFDFKFHHETREVDGFLLTVAKGGIKFKPTLLEEERCCIPIPSSPEASFAGGVIRLTTKGRFGMKAFAGWVSTFLPQHAGGSRTPVTDKTNLPGVYDITLLLDQIASSGGRGAGAAASQFSPSIPKAIEEQLGLHLEPGKVHVEFLFIDHLEKKATEN